MEGGGFKLPWRVGELSRHNRVSPDPLNPLSLQAPTRKFIRAKNLSVPAAFLGKNQLFQTHLEIGVRRHSLERSDNVQGARARVNHLGLRAVPVTHQKTHTHIFICLFRKKVFGVGARSSLSLPGIPKSSPGNL